MHIIEQVTQHLQSGADKRIVIGVQGGYRAPVFAAKDLPKMKAEGSGLRIGHTFVFASQIRFARVA